MLPELWIFGNIKIWSESSLIWFKITLFFQFKIVLYDWIAGNTPIMVLTSLNVRVNAPHVLDAGHVKKKKKEAMVQTGKFAGIKFRMVLCRPPLSISCWYYRLVLTALFDISTERVLGYSLMLSAAVTLIFRKSVILGVWEFSLSYSLVLYY